MAICALSISLPLLLWALLARPTLAQQRATTNLQRGLVEAVTDQAAQMTREPAMTPQRLRNIARRVTPTAAVLRLDRLLSRAGRPANWPVDRILVVKVVLPLATGILALIYLSASPQGLTLVIAIALPLISYFVPDLLLHSRGQERSQQIALELADTLDQMTIAVEAGLGFDSAMARAAKNGKGPLAQELMRTLQDMQVGQTRRQAYEGMARRTGVPTLRKFVSAIIQADMYGIAIADVLRTQADEMRIKRRQRAEEKAMQIPIKVIFPLMLCILPVLFIVLLGPAVLDIVAAFST
jgi:tight adherence protein C